MTTLTYTETKYYLRQAVAEKGIEHINTKPDGLTCMYFEHGAPSCIVGHVLHYKGITPDDFEAWGNESSVTELPHYLKVLTMDDQSRLVLEIAQRLQDEQTPWGTVVSYAIRVVDENGTEVNVLNACTAFVEKHLIYP